MIYILLFINMLLVYKVIMTSVRLRDYKKSYNKIKKQLQKKTRENNSIEKDLLKYGLSADRIKQLKSEDRITIKGL